ncbi:hypothetical protein V8C42DRAFT_327023 [Trichoderma barbatum]
MKYAQAGIGLYFSLFCRYLQLHLMVITWKDFLQSQLFGRLIISLVVRTGALVPGSTLLSRSQISIRPEGCK